MKRQNPAKSILFRLALIVFTSFGLASVAGAEIVTQLPSPRQQPQAQPSLQQELSADQLDNLVAPIALFPDPLLGQMLVASTYPLEVVEASQWLERNSVLQGQELVDAAKMQPWDSSVQALVAIPDALAKLNEDIRWTTDLGNAFLSQESDVLDAVQRMRERAQANGKLASTQKQKITTQQQEGRQAIIIEPADPQIIYVPVYDPYYVWGSPRFGYYPRLYYPPFGFGFGIGYNIGFCYLDWPGWGYWGWSPYWFGPTIIVNHYFFDHYGYHHYQWAGGTRWGTPWVHNPVHRLNVPYKNDQVATRFGGRSIDVRNPPQTGDLRPTPRTDGLRNMPRMDEFQNQTRTGGLRNPPRAADLRNSLRTSDRPQSSSTSHSSRAEVRIIGRDMEQGYRSRPVQTQRYENPPRQQYQSPQTYRAEPRAYSTPQIQQFQSRSQPRFQEPPISVPRMSVPQISVPRMSAPQISVPRMSTPRISTPHIDGGGFRGGSLNGGGVSRGGESRRR